MRKAQKKEVLDFIDSLKQAHEEIREAFKQNDLPLVQNMLSECQDFAISLGETIEKLEGEGHVTVSHIESYCEALFHIFEAIEGSAMSEKEIDQRLNQKLGKIENSVNKDIRIRVEAVFLPYKASMWDSLESVWKEADKDPDCDAYVIPIPYYDKNPNGSIKEMHYEGDLYPAEVPVIRYDAFDFQAHHPDVIFIHNPYDDANYVTSVHPFFYSSNIKKYTDCLVYIPYFASTGGMSEAQKLLPAYVYADYIVVQSEKYRKFYDERIPDERFLALGSPKFDSVIQKCQNTPKAPADWADKIENRKVYFYNTSLTGMLGNTEAFLQKMQYVFDTFQGREDACLLWRPHPLLESTFESLRKEYKPRYDALKEEYIREKIGIYDETPDIETSIALSDVYIGDAGTSVTSLFGVAGKPLFIFNNYIHTLPEKDDWRGERVLPVFDPWGNDRYQVTASNQLWFSERNDYHYRFYMDLETGYSGGSYYLKAVEIGDKVYVLPRNAQHLLVIQDRKIRKIELRNEMTNPGAFASYWYTEKYIFLLPNQYPFLVRFTIATEKIDYIDQMQSFYVRNVNGEWKMGGVTAYGNELVVASPVDNEFLFMDMDTLKIRRLSSHSRCNLGTQVIVPDCGEGLWLLPLNGMTVTWWDPNTGQVREYDDLPNDFQSVNWSYEEVCQERPFGNVAVFRENGKEKIVLSPSWGNMYVALDRETGKMQPWKPDKEFHNRGKNSYFLSGGMGGFVADYDRQGEAEHRIWYMPERKLYNANLKTGECQEIELEYDYEEVKKHEAGFTETSEWMQYCLKEDVLHSLKDLLDDHILGRPHSREKQLQAFSRVNASPEGNCGEQMYQFVKGKVSQ